MLIQTPRAALLAVTSALALSACATVPDLGARPTPAAPQSFASAKSLSAPEAAWPVDRWWDAYGDPQLSALIDEALAGSPSLAAAAARLRQAEAAAQQVGAARHPTVYGQGSTQASRQELASGKLPPVIQDAAPENLRLRASATLGLDYQLDFFGKNRAAFAAATSQTQAAQAEAQSARLELAAAVALAYADLLRAAENRAQAEEAVRLRAASALLVARRAAEGLETEAQVHQAQAELSAAKAEAAAIDGAIARTRNQIAALIGKGPDRGLEIALPSRPSLASPGLPKDVALNLVGRRPDLVAARLSAEAAGQQIKVAKADFYPNVNLSAVVGLQTLGLDRLGGGSLAYGQVGPAITLPIFDGGRVEGAYRGARAQYDEAVAVYDQALANALSEVATALSDRRALEAQLVQARAALASSEAAYRLARLRYQGGLASYIDTLSVENSLVSQRRAAAELEAQAFALDVALVRALGGGFSA